VQCGVRDGAGPRRRTRRHRREDPRAAAAAAAAPPSGAGRRRHGNAPQRDARGAAYEQAARTLRGRRPSALTAADARGTPHRRAPPRTAPRPARSWRPRSDEPSGSATDAARPVRDQPTGSGPASRDRSRRPGPATPAGGRCRQARRLPGASCRRRRRQHVRAFLPLGSAVVRRHGSPGRRTCHSALPRLS
jgi:hypothetical protein